MGIMTMSFELIFGKNFYNNHTFLAELLLHNEQHLQKLLNNFKKEFEKMKSAKPKKAEESEVKK